VGRKACAATVPLAMQGMHMVARDGVGEVAEILRKGSVALSLFSVPCCRIRSEERLPAHIAEASTAGLTLAACTDLNARACRLELL
jgi:hypothetical protein